MVFAFQKTRHPTFWAKLDFRAGIIFYRNYFSLDFSPHRLYIYNNPCRFTPASIRDAVRGVFLLYTPYCQVFPKGSRVIGNSAKQSRKRDSQCGAGPQIRNCGKEQVGVLPNIFPSCVLKRRAARTAVHAA